MKSFIHIFTSLIFLVLQGIAVADAPPLINYRGHFDGPPAVAGQPVSQTLVFSLYNSMTATESLWTETQQVSIFDGNFAVLLGSVTPLGAELFAEPIRYIGVSLDSGSELMRQQIISVPYAMRSNVADTANNALQAQNAQRADTAAQADLATMATKAESAAQADIAAQAVSAATAELAVKANQFGNLYAAPNGNIGYNYTDSKFRLTLGGDLSDTKLALWDNNDISHGMGVQAGQFRFHVAAESDRFSFFDKPKATVIRRGGGGGKGITGPNSTTDPDSTGKIKPDQIIIEPPIELFDFPTEIFTIQGNGRVGVGVPNPQQALDVAGNVLASGAYLNSDLRLKKNVGPLTNSLDNVLRLNGVEYEWKREEFEGRHFAEGKQIGLIAQEVEQVLPELVSTDRNDYKSVDYSRLVPVLVEAIKAQQEQIQALRTEIEAIKQTQ